MTENPVVKLEKEIMRLEALHKSQVSNARYYFWELRDDFHAAKWREIAAKTQIEIDNLNYEKDIIAKYV